MYLHRALQLAEITFIFGEEFLARVHDFVGLLREDGVGAVELLGISCDELNVVEELMPPMILFLLRGKWWSGRDKMIMKIFRIGNA